MDPSAIRISAVVTSKYATELLKEAVIAAERGSAAYRDMALASIGRVRAELTELELALKGEAVEPPPRPALRLVGATSPIPDAEQVGV